MKKNNERKSTGFKDFLLDTNLMEVAVAFILGMAFREIILALINNAIFPLITDGAALSLTVGSADFGSFIEVIVNFIITAITVFTIYKLYKRAGMIKTDK